jgi:hypothetical protein
MNKFMAMIFVVITGLAQRFGLWSATNTFETSLLSLIFENANIASLGDATGLRGSSTAGVFYISLATASPGETGTQATSETAYTNYVRVSVARSTAGWTATGNTVDNDAAITFAQCGATGASLTSFGIGSDSSGTGNLYLYGALTATLAVTTGITPEFAIGALDVTLD